jgi:hypothetical protein
MAQEPHLILLGHGVTDTLQLTVEAQRVLTRVGKVYALSLPPNLRRFLRALRVDCVELADRFATGKPYADAYLDVAEFVLRRTAEERPVVVLVQGNPLYLNALNRFFLQQARARDLVVQTLPGVSPLDAIICDLALDVGTFGLQLFDARRLVARQQQINPHVPLLLLQLAGFADGAVRPDDRRESAEYAPLVRYLGGFYASAQPVTLINLSANGQGAARATVPLARVEELVPHIRASSSLFIDAVQAQ